MKDPCIRNLLKATELRIPISEPFTKVVEELRLPVAQARIDIAVINGYLHGYEIKSGSDTLNRLENQIIAYEKVFDYITVVTEQIHYLKVKEKIPEWVGVSICNENSIEIKDEPQLNKNKVGFFVAKLLWKEELIEILREQNLEFNTQYRTWTMCEILSENLKIDILSDLVRKKLKLRQNWKVATTNYELM